MNVAASWRPKHAWFFLITSLLLSGLFAGLLVGIAMLSPSFKRLLENSVGTNIIGIIGLAIIFGSSLFFSKVGSKADFITAFGFTPSSEQKILLAFFTGILIQVVGIFAFGGGFSQFHMARRLQPTAVVLLAPFLEEPAMRGFAFKAFRNSYSLAISICLITVISLIFHWGLVYRSLYGCTVIAALNIALCILKEKHSSLWSCIACHLAFNLSYIAITHA